MKILSLLFVLFFVKSIVYAWEPPVLSSPSNGAFLEAGVTLDWNSVIGSDGYIVQIDTSQNFDSPVLFEKEEVYINSSNYNDDTREYIEGFFFGQIYHWRVRAFSGVDTSEWVGRSFSTYEILSFTSPSSGTIVETGATLDWEAFTGVDFYDYQIDTSADFNSPVLIEGSNAYVSSVGYNSDTRTYVENLFFGQQYYWRIRARTDQDTSEWNVDSFNTSTQIELFSPIDGSLIEAGGTLDWDAHTGIDFYHYQLDTSEYFNSSVLIEDTKAYENSSNYNDDTRQYVSNLFMNQEYHWRVRLINAVDTSEWSASYFLTDTYVDLTSPADDANVEVGVELNWEAFSGAEYYDFQLDTSVLFNSSVLISGSNEATSTVNYNNDTEYYVSGLYFGTTYHWRIRARNSNDTSEWKEAIFYTKDNVVLQSPADESVVENGVTLNWDAHSGVEFYHYQADTSLLFNTPALQEGINAYISAVDYNDDTEAYIDNLYFGKTYFWRVRALHSLDTSEFVSRSFVTSNDVDMVSPANNATNISTDGVTLNWDAHTGIHFYQLQVDSSNLFMDPVKDTLIAYISAVNYNDDTDFNLADLASETTYFWRLRVMNDVDTSDWTVRAFSTGNNVVATPDAPALVFPADNENFVLPDLSFDWDEVSNADSYEINWALSSNFEVFESMEITGSSYEVTDLIIDTTYFWRVRAKNGAVVSDWSTVYSFATGIAIPQLLSPTEGEYNLSVDGVNLTWEEVENATYEVQVSVNSAFNPAFISTVNTNAYTVTNLDHFQKYFWRVQSVYGSYNSEWSEVKYFKTRLAAPQLLLPANDSVLVQPDSAILHWQMVDSAESYTYQYGQASDFSSYIEGVINETETVLPELDESSNYFWRVKADKGLHESLWSEAFAFTTGTLIGTADITSAQWSIYPNPAEDYITIRNVNIDENENMFRLVNTLGQVIQTVKIIGNERRIDISELKPGMYLLSSGSRQLKFIKE